MVGRADIQYVRFTVVDGSAARKLNPVPPITESLPQVQKVRRKRIYVDPVAVLGIMVAVCMFVSMAVGLVQNSAQQEKLEQMETYVMQLRQENEAIKTDYANSYDLEAVERTALALGMIPKAQAETATLQLAGE